MSCRLISAALAALVFGACAYDDTPGLSIVQEPLATPAGANSGEPYLSFDGETVYLSWLEAVDANDHELRFSTLGSQGWSTPATIARSDRFFVNWADFPSLTPGPDATLWAHWLERGAQGGYDYGVRIVRSDDGGTSWSEPITPHDDDSPTEHGFVSAMVSDHGVGFVWLDGRKYVESKDGAAATHEMSLRYRQIGVQGDLGEEMLIDGRVCDCCQTSSAMTDQGPVTVYRDRSADEIRDIYVTRLRDGAWTKGVPVHEDGWHIGGCPVNGPAVAARGSDVAVAWFTAAGDVPRVKVAFSSDAGATFGAPIVVDDGNPAGRVDLLLEEGSALVSWLERTGGENAEVRLRRVGPDDGASKSVTLTASSAGRASGFPRLTRDADGALIFAWTDLEVDEPQVRVARVVIDEQ